MWKLLVDDAGGKLSVKCLGFYWLTTVKFFGWRLEIIGTNNGRFLVEDAGEIVG